MLVNKKAVSTIILIILILCSVVFGALISYMWVMGNFYLEPENTVNLVITQVDFPVDHADYFYVTVMNPSHSPSGTNITEIYFTVEGDNKLYNVTNTYPESLPITLEKGASETIKCLLSWGEFAGKIITVHVSAMNASGAVVYTSTEYVKLEVTAILNAALSCKQFNVAIKNDPQSAINLTLTKIYINRMPIENISRLPDDQNVTFPIDAVAGNPISLRCLYNWETFKNPTIRVETSEGYYAETSANATASVLLLITDVAFNETNPNANETSITVSNSELSSTLVDISDIALTYSNGTKYHINGSYTNPSFAPYYRLDVNKTVTFNHCIWNWRNYRGQNITIAVNVKQGFTPTSRTIKTPQSVIFKITELNFNLTDTSHFLVTVANMRCSLQNINITKIKVNGTDTASTNQIVNIGEEEIFNCTFDWASFRGKDISITAHTLDGLYTAPKSITLPSVDLKILVDEYDFAKSPEGIPYVNITVENTLFSNRNVTVTQIIFKTENTTDTINGALTNPALVPNGYTLNVNANVTILCPWNWTLYQNQTVTITVQTAEGFSISQTFQIPPTP